MNHLEHALTETASAKRRITESLCLVETGIAGEMLITPEQGLESFLTSKCPRRDSVTVVSFI